MEGEKRHWRMAPPTKNVALSDGEYRGLARETSRGGTVLHTEAAHTDASSSSLNVLGWACGANTLGPPLPT